SFVFPRNGKQLMIICEDNKYDFSLQETRNVKDIIMVKSGDEILVECNFQTLDRSQTTFVSLFFYLQIFHCF
ncbi:MOXD2 protein, partial [Pelecanoides urinatrix]|nr:MOXD2 protein [Pelecanoides urinatrix]